jgi:16S rRNA (guanine527-N7)-methyltransferase
MTAAEIEAAVAKAGIDPLGPEVAERFQRYLELLLKWNARLNLTAIREPQEVIERHFTECIFAARHVPEGIRTLLDFGSGGGFPGIPIAVCRPEIDVTLGESQGKKATFLREVIRTLHCENAEVYQGRVEALARPFDAVTLRAVDKMREACRAALTKIGSGGYLILFLTKGAVAEEVTGFGNLNWNMPIAMPASDRRVLLIGRKD